MDTGFWPVIIIGGGPAGLSAAVNARKRNKNVLVIAKEQTSHKLAAAPKVENYPGFASVSGPELGRLLFEHAREMGAQFVRDEVQSIYRDGNRFWLMCRDAQYQAARIILSVGVIEAGNLPGETELVGQGVSYCATCDGAFFKSRDVAMIAYFPEAEGEARFLAEICRHVYYLPQYKPFPAELGSNVTVIPQRPLGIGGNGQVDSLVLPNQTLAVDGVFIERPGLPPARLIEGLTMDGESIRVDANMETSIPGIYAAGDCTGRPWQIARAVGQGQIAAIAIARELDTVPAEGIEG